MNKESEKLKKWWVYTGGISALLAMLSITLGNYLGGVPPLPIEEAWGWALAILFLSLAAASAGVVNTVAYFERQTRKD